MKEVFYNNRFIRAKSTVAVTLPRSLRVTVFLRCLFKPKEGIIRSLWPEYKTYFKDDFHPWNNDNRELLENWEHLLEPS